jgi:hypothetical protein
VTVVSVISPTSCCTQHTRNSHRAARPNDHHRHRRSNNTIVLQLNSPASLSAQAYEHAEAHTRCANLYKPPLLLLLRVL